MMVEAKFLKFDTLSLHAGQHPDPIHGARATPIYQTTSYVFPDVDHAASLFNLERAGHIYSRISNPTVAVFEERMAALEGGVGAIGTASGQASLMLAVLTLMDTGGHIVASRNIYGGSHNLFLHTLPRFGIQTTLVDPRNPDEFRKSILPETRLLFAETIGNPGLEILDIPLVADIAHESGIPLMVDSTFTTPYLMQPFKHGADIIMHSATKWIGGHGIAIGGVLIDSGNFDWEKSGKFPTMTEPYLGYHGLDFVEEFGPSAFVMRARAEGMRDFGACLSPQNAFYLIQGLETLSIRMKRHVENARAIAEFLIEAPEVSWVRYPDLEGHPDKDLAKKLLPNGSGSIVTFGIKSGGGGARKTGAIFIESLEIFSHLANVGDAKSLVIHPASTTHQQMDAEELQAAGVGEEMIRVSVGLEDTADLVSDLRQALRLSQK
jgi:O-acetylhomoserine (thiol)-lyase|tara:strand:- start:3174 stop:4481 length:1308 start_codon:yes stop_codon:yes gene_type:complete